MSRDVPMQNPLISVVILNYRRWEALNGTLSTVVSQSYSPREVIVVDNGSGDGSADLVRQHFPEVTVMELEGNPGCLGRTCGVETAHGEFVVTIDNDVYFDSAFELQKIANAFSACPEASCIVFKVLESETGLLHVRDWCHPRSYAEYSDREFETSFIPEGACAFRREDFLKIGGYYEPLWIGCEGFDLSLRLLEGGGRIFYQPSIRVRHLLSQETRNSWRPYYYYTRNYLWIALRNYPTMRAVPFLAEKMAMMLCFAGRTGNLKSMFRGVRDAVLGFRKVWATRNPVSSAVFQHLADLSRERPNLWARLRRHRERPLI
jgi:GT2 family glycosyltransferase